MPTNTKAQSLSERESKIRQAFYRVFNTEDAWVSDVYDTYLIASMGMSDYYRVNFSEDENGLTFTPRSEWVAVEKEWIAAKLAEPVVAFGGSIKALEGGKFGGYLVVFGDENTTDLQGEFFTADTDFDIDDWDGTVKCSTYFNHGLDKVVGKKKLCTGTLKKDDVGIWLEGILDERDQYQKAIYDGLIVPMKCGMSSGTLGHLVERERVGKSVHITKWPLGSDGSITHIPAEPRTTVMALKALPVIPLELPTSTPAQQASAEGPAAQPVQSNAKANGQGVTPLSVKSLENETMPENMEERLNALETQLKSIGPLSEQLSAFLKHMEDSPALKNSGFYSGTGGQSDPQIKSFGDFLMAVMRHDDVRLKSVYGSIKDMATDVGTSGGYLVPSDYSTQLMQVVSQTSPIVNSVQQYNVTMPSGEWPALDIWTAPTAGVGNTAKAGKVTAAKRAEGGAYSETQPEFELIKWRVNDVASGYVEVSREMREDSALAIEQMLRSLFATVVANKLEYYILRGNGVGEPLGVYNAPAKIDVEPDSAGTFAFADAVEMISRFKNISGRSSQWIIHPGLITDIAAFQVTANNAVTFVTDMGGALRRQLLGYTLLDSEHMPQPNEDMCALLWDPGAYALWLRGQMYVDFSEHAAFTSGKDTWRFGQRVDGQPLWKGAHTLADPQGSFTVSPFISFSD